MIYKRLLKLPQETLFLWGPRQTGKTTLIKTLFPHSYRIDLLRSDDLIRLSRAPSILRDEIRALEPNQLIVIDEIQKEPALLDEVQYLIQEEGRKFILCGSSSRKVRKGHANLLGGRALRFELLGLSAAEIGQEFSLEKAINDGVLPSHYLNNSATSYLRAYVDTYLQEEVLQEGLTRSLPIFSDFLRVAALSDTEIINFSNIARESGIPGSTVRDYFAILVDTLLASFVPAFVKRPKRRVIQAPKFYFRDVGVVNHLARRGKVVQGSDLFGKAFENLVFHELSVFSRYSEKWFDISYWRLSSGIEVDFIIGNAEVAVEVKGHDNIHKNDTKNLLQFKQDYPEVKKLVIVCPGGNPRLNDNGIEILPFKRFIDKLWDGEIIE